ncbi:MAG: hypothetical protein WC943_16405 [Elusimicrobiota bacterium]
MIAALLFGGLLLSGTVMFRNLLGRRTCEAAFLGSLLACCEGVLIVLAFGAAGRLAPGLVALATFCLFILHGLVALFHQKEELPMLGGGLQRWAFPPVFWPAAAIFFAVLAFRLFIAWKTPPDAWDGLSYHLPIVFRWIRQGDLSLGGWPTFHRTIAHNGEYLAAWLSLLDGGRMEAAKLSQAAALPLMFTSAAVLGRRHGGAVWSLPCGLAACAAPLALIQAGIPYVDLFYGASFLAAAAAAVLFDRTGLAVHLAAFAAAFGLALGAKSTAYLQAPLLLLPFWTLCLRRDLRLKAALWLIPLTLLSLALGGSTYIENWRAHGNPVYPFEFKVGGWTVFLGPMSPSELLTEVERWFVSSPAGWLWYPFRESFRGRLVYGSEHGFGPVFAACYAVLPAAAWAALRSRNRSALWLAAMIPMTLAAFFLFQPTREPRYIMFLPGLVLPLAALALRRAQGWARSAARLGWSAGIILSCVLFLGWFGGEKDYRDAWKLLRSRGRIEPAEFYKARFDTLGQAWAFLDKRLERGDTVAVNYAELILPWAGLPPRAEVHVVGHRATLLPDALYGELPEEWMNLLDSLRVRYLGLWEPRWYPGLDEVERDFIRRQPDRFRLLGLWETGGMGKTAVYEVLPKPGSLPALPRD